MTSLLSQLWVFVCSQPCGDEHFDWAMGRLSLDIMFAYQCADGDDDRAFAMGELIGAFLKHTKCHLCKCLDLDRAQHIEDISAGAYDSQKAFWTAIRKLAACGGKGRSESCASKHASSASS